MKIGIDARFLTHPQMGGFKTYTVNLIGALSQVDDQNQYLIYVDRQPSENELPIAKNFTYKVLPATLPFIGMPMREQITLRRQIYQDELDIVHFLCNTAPVFLSANFVLSLLDVIQVKSPQQYPNSNESVNIKQRAINIYSKWTILNSVHNAKRVITLSHYEKEQISKNLGIPPEKINVTYFGVDPMYSQANSDTRAVWRSEVHKNHAVNRKFIMGVGYEPRKNIPLLIEAFSQLAPNHPDLDLIIVAAKEEIRVVFQQLVSKLELNSRVVILPAQQPCDLAILYNLAEAFVFPSERESFGAPPLEALACGVPTVAMKMTSLPEVLEDGAILIDGKDSHIWANAIEKVLTDDALRSNLISKGMKQAAKFTWQKCAEETVKVYRRSYEERADN